MSLLLRVLICVCLFVLPAAAQEPKALKGVALVIGESKYAHITPLANPGTDAQAIEKMLEDLGFDVTGVTDRDAKKLTRDFERFVEDADGADVALIYYSGHGIEAGGENWLVPVDADPAAIADGGAGLIALSPVLDELKATVPVTIFLIDACRSNPFPPGALIRKDGKTLEMSTGGLGAPRGFAQVTQDENVSLGTVIGFAAEPGRPALDGATGGNSPYAAAILRHLSAMPGQEFGLVMRMVTEEVYLKTKTQQRPWVNESLRTQLFFGAPEPVDHSPEGVITGERRKLLLTISALPDGERKQVEQMAVKQGVPIDTLYGVLASLGETDIPKDPEALAKALQSQAGKIKTMLDERAAIATDDPQLTKLAAAADQALADGAIKSARQFLDQAKELVEKSRPSLEGLESQIKAKREANAAIIARAGEAAELDFDFAAAARSYGDAFGWVKESDKALAAKYKTLEADAQQSLASFRAEPGAFDRAIAAYTEALALLDAKADVVQWAKATNNLANTYLLIGTRNVGAEALNKAIGLYRQALTVVSRDSDVKQWKVITSNLGVALQNLGKRNQDTQLLGEARAAFEQVMAAEDKAKDARSWAMTKANLGSVLADIGGLLWDEATLRAAVAALEDARGGLDKTANAQEYAQASMNLGVAYRTLGGKTANADLIAKSIAAAKDALDFYTFARAPVDHASLVGNMAIATTNLGAMKMDMNILEQALPLFEESLKTITPEVAPALYANLNDNMGNALNLLGQYKKDAGLIQRAAAAYEKALTQRSRDKEEASWAQTQSLIGGAYAAVAVYGNDAAASDKAVKAYRAALEVFTLEKYPDDWRETQRALATILQGQGIVQRSDGPMKEAMNIYEAVLAATPRETAGLEWAKTISAIATLQFMLGTTHMNKAEVEQSIASFDLALEEYAKSGTWLDRMMVNQAKGLAEQALKELFK